MWLPDSSGFVYTFGEGNRSIAHYDLETESWRVVVADSKANTRVPALSPDGKSIAVARLKQEDGRILLDVYVYSMTGETVYRSKNLVWQVVSGIESKHVLLESELEWCPNSQRLLISSAPSFANAETTSRPTHCAWLDIDKGKLHHFDSDLVPIPCGGFACRRDGTGVLFSDGKDIVFHQWNGVAVKVDEFPDAWKGSMPIETEWENEMAILHFRNFRILVNTTSGKAERIESEYAKHMDLDSNSTQAAIQFKNSRVLRYQDEGTGDSRTTNVEFVLTPFESKQIVRRVFKKAKNVKVGHMQKSPDGTKVALFLDYRNSRIVDTILVIEDSGVIPVDIETDVPRASWKENQPNKLQLQDDYIEIAKILSDPLAPLRAEKEKRLDATQVLAEQNKSLLTLESVSSNLRKLQFVADESSEALKELIAATRSLDVLPQVPSGGEVLVEGFILGLMGEIEYGLQQGKKYSQQDEARKSEARKATAAFQRLNAAKLMLPEIAKLHAGPEVSSGQIVEIYYVRQPPVLINSNDAMGLTLHLDGHDELHNCTVMVEITNSSNEVARNVHFIPVWKNNQTLLAKYLKGFNFGTSSVCRQTVSDATSITVSIWSDEASQKNIQHVLTPEERTKQVAGFCKDLSLRLIRQDYRSRESHGIFAGHGGVTLWFGGKNINFIKRCDVLVTYRDGERSQPVVWRNIENWKPEIRKKFVSEHFTWQPTDIQVEIIFPDNDYRPTFNWKISR